jgi:signal peptidase I
VASDSMAPVIRKHALVYAKKVNKENVDIGDVIVIKTGKTPVLHRVIEMTETTVTTKGDNNDNADNPVNWEFVKGKMIYQIPFLGIFIMSIYPWIILALFIAIYFVAKRLIKEFRNS